MLTKIKDLSSVCRNIYYLSKYEIGIPIFQRFYSWKTKQVIELTNDILDLIDNKDKDLYFLDFIYYIDDDKIMLADGQQRIVSLNNLIKAIKDVAREKNITISELSYFNIFYDVESYNRKYITHFSTYPTKPFKETYIYFKEFIEENLDKIEDIIDIIKNKIFVILKKCSSSDEAFEIFRQINTGGKPLSKDEVIKTALDQSKEVYKVNFDTSKMKDLKQTISSYYKLKTNNYNKNFNNIEIMGFLKEYICKDKETFLDFVEVSKTLKEAEQYPIKTVINYINRASLQDVINILIMKKIDINRDKDYLNKVVIPLCMMSITLSFNSGSPTLFRYLLNDVINMIKTDKSKDEINEFLLRYVEENGSTWKISLNNFIDKIGSKYIKQEVKKGLLLLDIINSNQSGIIDVNSINLEHIYPKRPSLEWANNGYPASNDEQKDLIDNIGNYLLLSEAVNKSIQNKYITLKVHYYKEIIERDRILQTKINSIDFEKFINNGKSYIYKRQKEIGEELRNTLPFGKVLIN